MSRIVRAHPARNDLLQIWLYVAERNETAADRLIDRFERTLRMLARHPLMGEAVTVSPHSAAIHRRQLRPILRAD